MGKATSRQSFPRLHGLGAAAPHRDCGVCPPAASSLAGSAGERAPSPAQGCGVHFRKGKELLGAFHCVLERVTQSAVRDAAHV